MMNFVLRAMGGFSDAAQSANCRAKPTVTLTFATKGDRYDFESTMRRDMDPTLAMFAGENRKPGEFELEGLILKLAVDGDNPTADDFPLRPMSDPTLNISRLPLRAVVNQLDRAIVQDITGRIFCLIVTPDGEPQVRRLPR